MVRTSTSAVSAKIYHKSQARTHASTHTTLTCRHYNARQNHSAHLPPCTRPPCCCLRHHSCHNRARVTAPAAAAAQVRHERQRSRTPHRMTRTRHCPCSTRAHNGCRQHLGTVPSSHAPSPPAGREELAAHHDGHAMLHCTDGSSSDLGLQHTHCCFNENQPRACQLHHKRSNERSARSSGAHMHHSTYRTPASSTNQPAPAPCSTPSHPVFSCP